MGGCCKRHHRSALNEAGHFKSHESLCLKGVPFGKQGKGQPCQQPLRRTSATTALKDTLSNQKGTLAACKKRQHRTCGELPTAHCDTVFDTASSFASKAQVQDTHRARNSKYKGPQLVCQMICRAITVQHVAGQCWQLGVGPQG